MKRIIVLVIAGVFLFAGSVNADLIFYDDFSDSSLTGWAQLSDPTKNQVEWVNGEITARDEYDTPGAIAGYSFGVFTATTLSFDATVRLEQNLQGPNQSDYVNLGINDSDFRNTYYICRISRYFASTISSNLTQQKGPASSRAFRC